MSNDFEFEFEDYDPLEAKPITKKSMVIFFVIDTSESMKGKKIDDLNRVMREIIPQLAGVGGCNTELKYAVLSFSSGCKWITSEPMIVEDNNSWKDLSANGITDLGMAFEELTSMLSRKKFLKSDAYENSIITTLMYSFALANQKISFKYIKDSKVVFETSEKNTLKDNIKYIFKDDFYKNLISVNIEDSDYKIYGYISNNHFYKGSRASQFLFVNFILFSAQATRPILLLLTQKKDARKGAGNRLLSASFPKRDPCSLH